MEQMKIGFVGFGEVNTPRDVVERKCAEALEVVKGLGYPVVSTAPVADDEAYEQANRAIEELRRERFDLLVVCVAGWIPAHAVIKVVDKFRFTPMILWGLCGWMEGKTLVSTADQAGTTGLRHAFQEMGYEFKYVWSVIGKPAPADELKSYADAVNAALQLRDARMGTMGWRDMLLYGTMADGVHVRSQIGVEIEPFEMLEIYQRIQTLKPEEIAEGVKYVRENFVFTAECDDKPIADAVSWALAIAERVRRRGYDAISLIDVDGMKKLMGIPPAMIFLLLNRWCGVCTIPENDIMGAITQLMVRYATGQIAAYAEFYEFFEDSVLAGVPDFIPMEVTDGDQIIKPSTFGLLSTSLLNVSKYKTGKVTMARLIDKGGEYVMQLETGDAKAPPQWEECGWEPPAPQLPSLEIFPDCGVEAFAQNVSSQHTILSYGDNTQVLRELCGLLGIEVL
ncbi:MAG: hypothetical protein IJC35_07240 [Oscillospiraceae bacterium]|nr:hypothetical protein [Oscillospiraceae bacterium]